MDPIAAVSEHGLLLVGVAVGLVWVIQKAIALRREAKEFVAHVVDERMPEAIKASLKNGIQELVDKKNAEQEGRMVKYIQQCFKDHEEREDANIAKLMEAVTKVSRRKR